MEARRFGPLSGRSAWSSVRDEDAIMLGLLGVVLLTSRRRPPVVDPGPGWLWPVPGIHAGAVYYPPTVSDGIGTPRPGGRLHAGVDVMYRRKTVDDRPELPSGTAGGSPWHFAPADVPVVAARAGKVWSVKATPRGIAVVLDHGKPWASFYQHLASTVLPEHAGGLNVATGKPTLLKQGDIIGAMGGDPLDDAKLRHLHFEIWRGGAGPGYEIDPAAAMRQWATVPWTMKLGV